MTSLPQQGDAEGRPAGSEEELARSPAAWSAVLSLALGVFGLATAEFLPASLLTPIASDLQVSIGAAGQVVTVTAGVAAVAGPALLIGAARLDRRTLVWAVSTLIVLSDLIAASATNLWVFLVGRIALGVALAGIGSLAASLCMRLVPPRAFSKAMAMIFTGMTTATIFAPPFGVYVGHVWGWRATFVCAAGIGLAAVLAQLLTVPSMPPTQGGDRAMFSRLLRRRGVMSALLAGMLIILGHAAGFTYVRAVLEEPPGLDADAISFIFLALGIGGFGGNLLAGVFAGGSARLSTGLAALAIAAATLAFVELEHSIASVMAAAFLWGIGFGVTPISVQTLTVQAAPDLSESVGAITMSAFQAAIAAGGIVGGTLADHFGPSSAIRFCTLAAIAGGWLILAMGKRAPGRPRQG